MGKKIIVISEQDLVKDLSKLDLKKIDLPDFDLVKFVRDYITNLWNKSDSEIEKLKDSDILKKILNGSEDDEADYSDLNFNFTPNFRKTVDLVIDKIEGGYYHPDMKKENPVKYANMLDSGETMFGMDRVHGAKYETDVPSAQEFWRIIDNERAKNPSKWVYLYRLNDNPTLASHLKDLIAQTMEPAFKDLQKRYLSPEAIKIVNSDPLIYFHFAYSTWNGSGYFQKFANLFNERVKNKMPIKELRKSVLEDRKTHPHFLARRNGRKIEDFATELNWI